MADKPPEKNVKLQPIYRHDPIGQYLETVVTGQVQLDSEHGEEAIKDFRQHVVRVLTHHPCRGCPSLVMAELPPTPADAPRDTPTYIYGRQNPPPQTHTAESYADYNYDGHKPFCTARVTVHRHPIAHIITAVHFVETWHRCPLYGISSVNEGLDHIERRLQTLTSHIMRLEKRLPPEDNPDPDESGSRILDIPSAEPALPEDEMPKPDELPKPPEVKIIRPAPRPNPKSTKPRNGLEDKKKPPEPNA